MRDREAAWAASALGTGEAEQETLAEDANGGIVRRSRRTLTAPLVPARVLENFGVGDAILSAAATVTGGERRLERFRVALPGNASPGSSRSATWAARMLGVSAGVLVAVLVVGAGLLHSPHPGLAGSTDDPNMGVARLTCEPFACREVGNNTNSLGSEHASQPRRHPGFSSTEVARRQHRAPGRVPARAARWPEIARVA